jgi:hypothetical protein
MEIEKLLKLTQVEKHKHRVKVNGDKNIVIQKCQYRKISRMIHQFHKEQYIVHGNRTVGNTTKSSSLTKSHGDTPV